MATKVYVQFSDSTDTKIAGFFASPQDPSAYENLGTVETSDASWATFYNSLPSYAQEGLPAPG